MFTEMGILHKNVSQNLAPIHFSIGEAASKTLPVRKNFIGNINLAQTRCLNLEKFGIGKDNPNCQLTGFQ